jgi:hypothetical protein
LVFDDLTRPHVPHPHLRFVVAVVFPSLALIPPFSFTYDFLRESDYVNFSGKRRISRTAWKILTYF